MNYEESARRTVEPPRAAPQKLRSSFGKDFLASLVVFLVALPLCMGIAPACGLPITAGILTGIIGGLVVGTLGGCPLQVSGPAAGLILVIHEIVLEPGGVQLLAICLILAGVIQTVAGLLKLGQWFRAVPPAVIEGMLAGIGVVIIATQLPHLFDGSPPAPPSLAASAEATPPQKHGVLHHLAELPNAVADCLFPGSHSHNTPWALVIGALTLVVLAAWRPLVPKASKIVPAAFVAVSLAVVASFFLPVPIKTIPSVASLDGTLQQALAWPSLQESLAVLLDWKVVKYTLTLALVASAETLLCAGAVDQMQDGPRTHYDKELWAQGIGNILCGLLHALPMTGVIVRSKANIEAGAKTRASAVLHGTWLLLFLGIFSFALQVVPNAALAAVLVFTGVRLIDVGAIKELRKIGWSEVAIYATTLIAVVVFGLLEGVLVGSVLALVRLLYQFSHLAIRVTHDPASNRTLMALEGAATFIRLPQLAGALEKVPANAELHVQLDRLAYIDHACLELLIGWEKQHEATGGSLVIDWESLHARFRGAPSSSTYGSPHGSINKRHVPSS